MENSKEVRPVRASRRHAAWATLFVCALTAQVVQAASHPPAQGRQGAVAADADLATRVGIQILEAGGTAADAAIATAFALGVVHPHASGIGGGGFALVYDRAADEVTVIDFRERAPAAASADMFLVDGEVDRQLEWRSGLAVGIPGEVAGLWALHQRSGRLPWADLVAPAIQLADDGFPAPWHLQERVAAYAEDVPTHAYMSERFATGEALIRQGQPVRRPDLAATLRLIAEHGPDGFYQGQVAEQIVGAVTAAGGHMTMADLAGYTVRDRTPIRGTYRGHTLYAMPPPSSGGVTMLQILAILEGFDLQSMGHNSSQYIHTLAEAMQFAFADRANFLGDPEFVEVPLDRLLDPELPGRRREQMRPDQTQSREDYGLPVTAPPDDSGTSHLSVVDSERNMVALTTTINTSFGTLIVPQGTGIFLNNEMADFTAQPGVPNVFGLLGNAANAIAPGKTPLSSMSPTLVFREGEPYMTLGGSGGPRIITGTMQTFLNVVEFDMTISEAVDSPRVHHQWVPEVLLREPDVVRDVEVNLQARGHDVRSDGTLGAVQAVVVDGDWVYASSDPRKAGHALAY